MLFRSQVVEGTDVNGGVGAWGLAERALVNEEGAGEVLCAGEAERR